MEDAARLHQLHTKYTSSWQNVNENTFPAAKADYGRHPHFHLIESPPTPTAKERIITQRWSQSEQRAEEWMQTYLEG